MDLCESAAGGGMVDFAWERLMGWLISGESAVGHGPAVPSSSPSHTEQQGLCQRRRDQKSRQCN